MMIKRTSLVVVLLLISCEKITSPFISKFTPSNEMLFISIRNRRTILLANLDGSNQYAITADDIHPTNPTFSPDGKHVLFSSISKNSASRSLYLYCIQNGKREKITDDYGQDDYPSFSHDGSKIVFTSNRNSFPTKSNIFILDLKTKKIKQITNSQNLHYNPIFSPYDSKILFSRYYDGYNHLSIIDTNGTNIKNLETSHTFLSNFQFSSSGDRVYYRYSQSIISNNIDGSDRITTLPDSSANVIDLLVSPTDSILYYCGSQQKDNGTDEYSIVELNLNTLEKIPLKKTAEFLFLGDCSIDGSKLLYQQHIDGPGDIFLMDLENGTDINITNSDHHDCNPIFNRY